MTLLRDETLAAVVRIGGSHQRRPDGSYFLCYKDGTTAIMTLE